MTERRHTTFLRPFDTTHINTDSGPAQAPDEHNSNKVVQNAAQRSALAKKMAYNQHKDAEYGAHPGQATVGTTTSVNSLVNETKQGMSTNQGVPLADNQNSLKAGLAGPALLKDFILREKITHFDHERIPERVVHARGSGAHGYFECYQSLTDISCASLFSTAGKITPVFARFSTVAGERGSKDTARDVRGFAVKFYTEQGNWDLVGNNMPVFFIQDAMKFPDLVHALKPEPHHGMPQAASAHDTFWDFISLMPESAHMILWLMSERAIPRSYRMMQGFGVHTFKLVNTRGQAKLVKFHWTPIDGVYSHVWDEAVKIAGADPDYHRRDLWEAIEAGHYPEWELGVQIFDEQQAAEFSFDVLDATKLVPEELVPITPIGKMVLNRNPDNFFAETEQVAFCAAHVVPGIDFTNDPLLAGRIHSYNDTQLLRLGGPNFHEIPINSPRSTIHNNQRDGIHRQAVHKGQVAYEPNSLAGGCPFQQGQMGYIPFPEVVEGVELRGKPEKFAEHYNQAILFYASQTEIEKEHIRDAFIFELSKVTVAPVRARVVALLRNISDHLAQEVAEGLGMPELPSPLPQTHLEPVQPEVVHSAFLSSRAYPSQTGVRGRKIAILVAPGINAEELAIAAKALIAEGALVRLVGPHIGLIPSHDNQMLDADASLSNCPAVLFDALYVPDGETGLQRLAHNGLALEFVRDMYRHGKTIFAQGSARTLLEQVGIDCQRSDTGIVLNAKVDQKSICAFIHALSQYKHLPRNANI